MTGKLEVIAIRLGMGVRCCQLKLVVMEADRKGAREVRILECVGQMYDREIAKIKMLIIP